MLFDIPSKKMKLTTPALEEYSHFIISLYEQYSTYDTFIDISTGVFSDYLNQIQIRVPNKKCNSVLSHPIINKIKLPESNSVMLGFSGGKDSLATAIKLKELGRDIHLYFLQGINKSYTTELDICKNLAQKLNLPLIVEKVIQNGKSDFKENPFKNGVLISLMIERGLRMGVSEYCLGNQSDDNIHNCEVLTEFSDTSEFFEAIKNYFDFVNINTYLKDDRDSYETIWKYNPELINNIGSCIMPVFRRPNIKKANKKKFGVELSGCGSCYKCSIEYIFKSEKGMLPLNIEYLNHCKSILDKHGMVF